MARDEQALRQQQAEGQTGLRLGGTLLRQRDGLLQDRGQTTALSRRACRRTTKIVEHLRDQADMMMAAPDTVGRLLETRLAGIPVPD